VADPLAALGSEVRLTPHMGVKARTPRQLLQHLAVDHGNTRGVYTVTLIKFPKY